MRLSKTIAFGGSELDRASQLRGSQEAIPAKNDKGIILWKGKLLFSRDKPRNLMRIDLPNSVAQGEKYIFIGIENGIRIFAFDISDWEPEGSISCDDFVSWATEEQVHPAFGEMAAFCELRNQMACLSSLDAEIAATANALFNWHKSHSFCSFCGQQSRLAMSGWQRFCEFCETTHFPRTDPVVIMLVTHANKVLLGRSPHWPENMYSLLAGFLEPGETVEAAVRREVFEECGVKIGEVDYLASQPWAFPNSLMIGCRADAKTSEINLCKEELEDALWVGKAELLEAFTDKYSKIKPARQGSIANFLLKHWLTDFLN